MIPQNQSSLQIGVPDQVSRKTDPLSTRGIFNLPRVHVSTSPLSNYTREDNAITRGVVVVVVVGANGSLYTHVHTYIACKKVAALTLSPPSFSLASARIGPSPLESISSIAASSFASQSDRSSGIVIHDRRLDGYAGAFSKGKGLPSFLRFPRTRAPRSSFYRVPALSLLPPRAHILHGIPSCSPPANLRALIKFSLGTLTERGPSFIKRRIKAIFP